jgi:HicB_like antitoxin of bacterial toxin-antitoxin system
VPDLPGCFSAGDTVEEAFDNDVAETARMGLVPEAVPAEQPMRTAVRLGQSAATGSRAIVRLRARSDWCGRQAHFTSASRGVRNLYVCADPMRSPTARVCATQQSDVLRHQGANPFKVDTSHLFRELRGPHLAGEEIAANEAVQRSVVAFGEEYGIEIAAQVA